MYNLGLHVISKKSEMIFKISSYPNNKGKFAAIAKVAFH